jgi:hypothetical protein
MPDGSMQAGDIRIDGTDVKDRVVNRVRSLEDWYSAELGRRLADLAEILNAELRSQIEEVQSEYEKRCQDIQKNSVQLPQGHNQKLLDEITRSERDAAKCAAKLETLVPDDSIALGELLKIRAQELELKAYVRGLKFLGSLLQAHSPRASS